MVVVAEHTLVEHTLAVAVASSLVVVASFDLALASSSQVAFQVAFEQGLVVALHACRTLIVIHTHIVTLHT